MHTGGFRQQEAEWQRALELAPQLFAAFGPNRDRVFAGRPASEVLGLNLDEWETSTEPVQFFHAGGRHCMLRNVYSGAS